MMLSGIEEIEVLANEPWLLSGVEDSWFIVRGKVDLFVTERLASGEPGLRRHFLRLGAGDMVFGFPPQPDLSRYDILAQAAPNTSCKFIDKTALAELKANPDTRKAWVSWSRNWIQLLGECLSEQPRPRATFMVSGSGQEHISKSATAYASSHTSFFIKVLEGEARWLGAEFTVPNQWYVLTSAVWLGTISDTHIDVVEFEGLGQEEMDLALKHFHEQVEKALCSRMEREREQERDRQEQRVVESNRVFSGALTQLSNILTPSNDSRVEPSLSGEQAILFTACKSVFGALGVKAISPPKNSTEIRPDELLGMITRASSVNRRIVTLSGHQWWNDDVGPLLAFWKENDQPVALIPDPKQGLTVFDPADGTRRTIDEHIASLLGETGFMFFPVFPSGILKIKDVLLFGLKNSMADWFIVAIAGISGGLLGLLTPMATGYLVSSVIPEVEYNQLLQMAMILLVATLTASAFGLANAICMMRINARMGLRINAAMMDRLIHMPANFFRDFSSGDLAMRAYGMDSILHLITGTTLRAVMSGIFSIFNFLYLFLINSQMAFVALVITLVAMLVTTGVNLRRLSYERKLTEADGRIEGEVFQLLTGITKLRVAAAEGRAFARWADRFSGLSTNSFRAEQLMNGLGVFNSGLPVIASICIFATLFFGETGLNPGGFISFNSAFSQFLGAGIGMSVALTSILNVIPLYERMKPILNTSPEVDDLKPSAPELTGDIEISSVTFGYKDSPVPVLNDLSLKIRSGEFVALVGASGCGKSTLFRLLLGFEKPQSGTIYYDKQDLDALDIVSVRRQLGVVLQNGKLIPGSIFTNIVGSLPLGQAEVEEAIRMAGMEEDLKAMPMGIHTMISEGASTLSGGQRQRLMIARALASKPRILLFDEATSALDNRTQALVSQSVEMLNVTRLVIAHRLSTIRNADRIIVFDKGRIIESGSYDELVELNGHFMELAKRQLA